MFQSLFSFIRTQRRKREIMRELLSRWKRCEELSRQSGEGMIGVMVDQGLVDWLDSELAALRILAGGCEGSITLNALPKLF